MTIHEINGATVERLKQFFFDCMLRGSLGDAERQTVPGMPDFRKIEFAEGDLRFLDLYTRSLGTYKSHGFINMWLEGKHVWAMSLSGQYERSALPMLKVALHQAYEAREFVGGRGPKSFDQHPFSYTNEAYGLHFGGFGGHETVWELDPDGRKDQFGFSIKHSIGSQRYQGGLLVNISG